MKKPLSLFLAVILILFAAAGCISGPKEKSFEKAGMTIVLTDDFVEKEIVFATAYYESENTIASALKQEFYLFGDAEITLPEYAQFVIYRNDFNVDIQEKEGLTCFEREIEAHGKDYTFFTTFFKGDDAFWLFEFMCETKNYEELLPSFIKYAKSVKI